MIGQAVASINLGPANQLGLTVVATATNAEAILGLNPPAPAPQSGVFKNHYAELYAQLVVTHLNMLRGATCTYITATIQGADAFIGFSPNRR